MTILQIQLAFVEIQKIESFILPEIL